ncbi:hypothetical protein RND71_030452 [Anisodus tanguticus]|uniref:BHLH domain-containing protein n=1 Tax=Anisodus tanguticus TaxID=243964 RepID=A0AAE1RH87_9SOLA|nr:hypothetical protein RND71_030452 [Anisodus tanguticus]
MGKRRKAILAKYEKKGNEEAPRDNIHVRARRGQATDSIVLLKGSHVRREKISERMKILHSLVPGCDKVTGKALMLDEIINYIQSLQNQIEFLTMKLGSLNPMYCDYGMDLDALMVRPDDQSLSGLETPPPNIQQVSATTSQAAEIIPNTNSGYPFLDNSASLTFQQANFLNYISQFKKLYLKSIYLTAGLIQALLWNYSNSLKSKLASGRENPELLILER